jgi:hypothetical protein
LGIVDPGVIARSEVMRHPASRELFHLSVGRKNSLDCVRGCPEPISQAACGEKLFVTQKLSYGLCKVVDRSTRSGFIFEGEIAVFEALAPMLDRAQADSAIAEDLSKLVMYRFISLLRQEQKFHHISLLDVVYLDLANVLFYF